MSKGLCLARHFHKCGHKVIGADFSSLACGRYSKSLSSFYHLSNPSSTNGSKQYVRDLLNAVTKEGIDLWVTCSAVASALEDGQAAEVIKRETRCEVIQFDTATTAVLHEKHHFIESARAVGLRVPDTHLVTSQTQMEKVFMNGKPQSLIAKCVGVDDSARGDMTLLPLPSRSATTKHLQGINVSEKNPWILQEFISGKEYCTHALVIQGQVRIFVACPSSELLMHYEALEPESVLSEAMLRFTKTLASTGGETFTGHLSFDFLVDNPEEEDINQLRMFPIECNPRAHTAVVLFNKNRDIANAYLSRLDAVCDSTDQEGKDEIISPHRPDKYFWIAHDLVHGLVIPFLQLAMGYESLQSCWEAFNEFVRYGLWWRDGTFETWDPVPWWWLYHVYWPAKLLDSLISGTRWSRINVSTTKMFEC
ncbi:MAG: hypothetical protein M1831_007215 [Alyxoria varia]|nr:MAG: hypothetical protein M1831_007215 [Alyxoria varia]